MEKKALEVAEVEHVMMVFNEEHNVCLSVPAAGGL